MYYKYHLAASNSQQQENNGVTDANWKLLTEKKKTKKTNKMLQCPIPASCFSRKFVKKGT